MIDAGKGKWSQIFYSRWFLIALFVLVLLLAFSYARIYYQEYKVREEIKNLQDEAHNLEAKKIESMEILKYVQSDAFVEEKARTELNLSKPGEKEAVFQNGGRKSVIGQPENNLIKWSSTNNPLKWLKFFFFKNNN